MEKGKSVKRASAPQSPSAPKTVDEYLATVPDSARNTFNQLRATIRSAVPSDATETISYRIPAYKRNGVLLWFAAFSNHCSLFPTGSVIEQFTDELKTFAVSKGTIHFPLDKPLPVGLIKKIVKARVAQDGMKRRR